MTSTLNQPSAWYWSLWLERVVCATVLVSLLRCHLLTGRRTVCSSYAWIGCLVHTTKCFGSILCTSFPLTNINPLKPNDPYRGRTAPLTSKRCILYIYSTNIGTEYFKHGMYSPFFSLQNAVCFLILTYLVLLLFTFYIQGVLKLKKIIPAPKG